MAILQIPLPPTDNAALVRAWRTWAGLKLRYVKNLETVPVSSPKALEAAEAFGGGLENLRLEVYRGLELEIEPGMVVYVTGESGGGKSLLLRYMAGVMARHSGFAPVAASWEIEVDRDRPLIETVKGGLQRSIGILSAAGLSDLFTWLRPHKMLSDGQKLRHLFALALDRGARTVILDEFCSNLDRETAKATAYTIQKYARRNGLTLVVGTAVDDLLEDLAPDLLVVKHIGPHVEVRRMAGRRPGGCSLLSRMRVEDGGYEDWLALSFLHYRSHRAGGVRKIYRLVLDGMAGSHHPRTVGVVVYSTPYFKAGGYGHCFNRGWYERRRFGHILRIQRVVIHPSFRGIGASKILLTRSMPMLGTAFVEILSVMQRVINFTKDFMAWFEVKPSEEKLKALKGFEDKFGVGLSQVAQTGRLPRGVADWVRKNYKIFLDRAYSPYIRRLRDRRILLLTLRKIHVSATPKVYGLWVNPDPRFRDVQLEALRPEFVERYAPWLHGLGSGPHPRPPAGSGEAL